MKQTKVVAMGNRGHVRRRLACLALALIVILLVASPSGALPTGSPARAAAATAHVSSFTLDNVTLAIALGAELPPHMGVAAPGNASQVASFSGGNPLRELAVTAVPFGTRPGTEQLPVARAGGSAAYYAALRDYRVKQGAQPVGGPTATIFGAPVAGLLSHVYLPLRGAALSPAVIVEWVTEAGNRLWIVRVTAEQEQGVDVPQWPGELNISSTNLSAPSTLTGRPESANPKLVRDASEQRPADDLPYPAWWNGSDCDYARYYSGSGGRGSYRLGGQYRGMFACGPRPVGDGAPDVLVHFFPGSWGEFDFECVELAMRYLYLAYGIAPYQANGNTVVPNYRPSYGGNLAVVGNGTPGVAPLPGDVLSYGAASTFGHAAVVSGSSVDGSGNGTITVVEENNAADGESTLGVSNWWVSGNAGSVIGWLTPGGAVPTPLPTATPTATPGPRCPGERFPDVCPDDYFYVPVLYLSDRGVISGYSDGNFRPYLNTTRGQLSKIIVLAMGWALNTWGGPHFRDVAPDNPFYAFIETAYSHAVISGYSDGTFRWGANITRAQLAKVIVVSRGWPIDGGGYQTFTDVPPGDPFFPFVQTAYYHNALSGYSDGTFRPGYSATRGQIARVVYAALTAP